MQSSYSPVRDSSTTTIIATPTLVPTKLPGHYLPHQLTIAGTDINLRVSSRRGLESLRLHLGEHGFDEVTLEKDHRRYKIFINGEYCAATSLGRFNTFRDEYLAAQNNTVESIEVRSAVVEANAATPAVDAEVIEAVQPSILIAPDLTQLTIRQLKKLASKANIHRYGNMTKAQLIEALTKPVTLVQATERESCRISENTNHRLVPVVA